MRRTALLALSLFSGLVLAAPVRAESRVPLAATVTLAPADTLETDGRTPDYLRALATTHPDAAPALARMFRTTIFGGTLSPRLKLAMGVHIADTCRAPYAAAHLRRLEKALPAEAGAEDAEAARLALRYAADLTRDIYGVSDAEFRALRGRFNDAQVVELTLTTCFFNYFARLTAGLGLTPEPWLATTAPRPPKPADNPYHAARVTLLTDAEMASATALAESSKTGGLGIGVANSRRAMIRVPDIADAWFAYWQAVRKGETVPRSTLLQVSLAVSTLNGCRYCVLHQVVGLRRQGVEVSKLLALKKEDSALTPEERAAVDFARKLTKSPGDVTDADWKRLSAAFPGRAAADVLLQTCAFAFMNRFTDGLRLPSEEEAIHIYRQVYGSDFPARP
jgi:AhpD family alkylhydroperoxidase